MMPATPMINPIGKEKNMNQGAAATPQFPSFASGPQTIGAVKATKIGEKPSRSPAHPIQQPTLLRKFEEVELSGAGSCSVILSLINNHKF